MVSLMIYISAFLMIIGVMGTVINFFSDNTKEINLSVAASSEYNKFNLYMLDLTKNGFQISEGTSSLAENNYVTFVDDTGDVQEKNTFVKLGNILYFNEKKLCENVDDFKVRVENANNGKKVLKTYLQVNGTVYTTDYVVEQEDEGF